MPENEIISAIIKYLEESLNIDGVTICEGITTEPSDTNVINEAGYIAVAYENDRQVVDNGFKLEGGLMRPKYQIFSQYLILIGYNAIELSGSNIYNIKYSVIRNLTQLQLTGCEPMQYMGSTGIKRNGNDDWIQLRFQIPIILDIPTHTA